MLLVARRKADPSLLHPSDELPHLLTAADVGHQATVAGDPGCAQDDTHEGGGVSRNYPTLAQPPQRAVLAGAPDRANVGHLHGRESTGLAVALALTLLLFLLFHLLMALLHLGMPLLTLFTGQHAGNLPAGSVVDTVKLGFLLSVAQRAVVLHRHSLLPCFRPDCLDLRLLLVGEIQLLHAAHVALGGRIGVGGGCCRRLRGVPGGCVLRDAGRQHRHRQRSGCRNRLQLLPIHYSYLFPFASL